MLQYFCNVCSEIYLRNIKLNLHKYFNAYIKTKLITCMYGQNTNMLASISIFDAVQIMNRFREIAP
jgi:hypothetical protein